MASIQKKGKVYYICDWINGKLKWIRLGDIPFVSAKAALARYHTEESYLRLDISLGGSTINELIKEYLLLQKEAPTKKKQTVEKEASLLKIFSREFGAWKISKFDNELVDKWFALKKYKPKTIRHYSLVLNQIYKLAIKRGYLKRSPVALHCPKIVQNPPKHVDDETINLVFEELGDKRVIFEIMLYAGLRPSECLRLRAENIDLKKMVIDLYPSQTKTATRGLIPIHERLVPYLKKLPKKGYLFPWGEGHQKEVKKALSSACARASKKHKRKLHFTPYQLRHTFATRLLEKTGDIRVVQQLMRHTSIIMTTRYATALDHKLREAIGSI